MDDYGENIEVKHKLNCLRFVVEEFTIMFTFVRGFRIMRFMNLLAKAVLRQFIRRDVLKTTKMWQSKW